jgi:prepilin-type N-terminal cleavage/methylation domain-containing protein
MRNNKGFSLVEMLVALIVAAIMILMIGVLSNIGQKEYKKVYEKQAIYNDISYGFKLIENRVRDSDSMTFSVATAPSWGGNPPWIKSADDATTTPTSLGGRLIVRHTETSVIESAFCLYQENGSTSKNLVYVPDISAPTIFDRILTVDTTTDTLNLTFRNSSSSSITVRINGTKNNISFDISNVVLRRTP